MTIYGTFKKAGIPIMPPESGGVWGRQYFVDGTNGSDSNSGEQPDKAFKTIQTAVTKQIAYTSGLGDVIRIFPGTYAESITASAFDNLSMVGLGVNPDAVIVAPTAGSGLVTGTDGTAAASMTNSLIKNMTWRAPSTSNVTYPAVVIGYMVGSVIEDCKFKGTTTCAYGSTNGTVGLQISSRTYVAWEFHEHSRVSRCEFTTNAGRNKELSYAIRIGTATNTTPSYRGFKSMIIEDCLVGAYDTGILLNTGAASCNGTVIRRNIITSHQGGDGVNEGIVSAADDGTDTMCLIADNKIQAISDCIKNFAAGNCMGNIVSVGNATPDTEYFDGS